MRQPPSPAARRFAAMAVAAGLLAAVAVPGNRIGLGVVLVAAAATAVVAGAGGFSRSRGTALLALLAIALAGMALIRTAPWLLTLDLIAATALTSLASSGAASWRGVRRGLLATLRRLPGAPVYLAWCSGLRPGPRALRGLLPATRGLALGVVLVAAFGALFASADPAFAQLTGELLDPNLDLGPVVVRALAFAGVAALIGALALVSAAGPRDAVRPVRSPRAREWVVALVLLDAVFAAFVAVQLTVLFGGHDHVLETAGLTYAEYAREGFFQLLVVAWLTLVVVALAARHRGERAGLRPTAAEALLALLCLLALVVLASALRRLSLYEDAYGFTVDRLLGHAATLWVGAVLLLVLVAGALRRSAWLPRTLVGVSGAGLLALTLANPEGLVAERNVERYRQTGKIDRVYLQSLSPDATPALTDLPDDQVACALGWTPESLEDPDGLLELNAGRAAARTALARRGPAVDRCP